MRELLDKIQQLPVQKSPNPPSTSGGTHSRAYFHRVRAKTLYMPLGDVQTVNSGNASQSKAIPSGKIGESRFNTISGIFSAVFSKRWLSRSAPCTPCGTIAPPFPSGRSSHRGSKTRVSDGSPLLKQHAEEADEDSHRDVFL